MDPWKRQHGCGALTPSSHRHERDTGPRPVRCVWGTDSGPCRVCGVPTPGLCTVSRNRGSVKSPVGGYGMPDLGSWA